MSERPNYESSLWKVKDEDLEWRDATPESAPTPPSQQPQTSKAAEVVHTNLQTPPLVDGKRQVALNRIVGMDIEEIKNSTDGTPRNAGEAFPHYERRLKGAEGSHEAEIEKTPEQKDILCFVIGNMPEFLKEYGLDHPVALDEKAFHILDFSKLSEEMQKSRSETPADWTAWKQNVRMYDKNLEGKGNINFAEVSAHELIHAHSFQSLGVHIYQDADGTKRGSSEDRKGGFVHYVREKDKGGKDVLIDYFAQIDEAITQTLAQRFIAKKLPKIPHSQEALEQTKNRIRDAYAEKKAENPNARIRVKDASTGLWYGDGKSKDTRTLLLAAPYDSETKRLRDATKDICKKAAEYQSANAEKIPEGMQKSLHDALMAFHNPEDVFRFFTKAYFSGRQLPVARLLSWAYPDKSFRQIGHDTNLVKKRNPQNF